MIDLESLKASVNLLTLAGSDSALRRVAATNGGEWAGPCPFCGGVDRFRVQPNNRPYGRYMCRHCTEGRWCDVIDYIMRRNHVDFRAACESLAGGNLPVINSDIGIYKPRESTPAYTAPDSSWQSQAQKALDICAGNLWGDAGRPALDYLRGRGLGDETIRQFGLGFSPGAKFGDLYIPAGIVIPCVAGGEVWYIKIRVLPGRQGRHKYLGVKGNRTAAIFGADELRGADMALFVEGEFDAMIAAQVIGDVIPVVTLGAATNRIDLAAWGAYLVGLRRVFVAYDSDQAGEKGAAVLAGLFGEAQAIPLPAGAKDINDYHQAGGDLWDWIKPYLLPLTEGES